MVTSNATRSLVDNIDMTSTMVSENCKALNLMVDQAIAATTRQLRAKAFVGKQVLYGFMLYKLPHLLSISV